MFHKLVFDRGDFNVEDLNRTTRN